MRGSHRRYGAYGAKCLVGAAALLLLGSDVSVAQPPQDQSQQPAPWAQGRPKALENSPLRPHSPPLTPKAAQEIPIDKVKLPPGFEISVWPSGLPNARSMTVGNKGTVFVGTRLVGKVYAVVDKGDSREFVTIAQGLHRPNGVAFKDGGLYVAEVSRILRYDNIEGNLKNYPTESLREFFGLRNTSGLTRPDSPVRRALSMASDIT